jgi:hypothetical protein
MVDALDAQAAPITRVLRLYARRQAGCRALMKHYGIGELTAVRSWPSSATRGGSPLHAKRSAMPGWTSPSISPISAALPGTSRARDRRRCAGRCSRPRRRRAGPAAPTARITTRPPSAWAATGPASRSRASCSSAASRRCATSAARACPPERFGARPALSHSDAPRPAHRMVLPHIGWTASKDRAAAPRPAGTPHHPSRRRPGTDKQ